jgi:Putative peptidoglycan binding domain
LLGRREVRNEPDLDDWFAEPKPLPDQWSLPQPEPGKQATPGEEGELADWLQELPQTAQRSPRKFGGAVGARRLALAAALLGLCLLIGLAAAGVFGGHSHRATAPRAGAAPASARTASSAPAPFTPPTPRAPATTLKLGARGAAVTALQRALARLGYYSGRIDGQYGAGTASAVSRFQTASAVAPDGIVGPRTLRALRKAVKR